MANWAELPQDLLISIAQRIKLMEDYAAFRAVCNSWRAVATSQNFKGMPLRQHTPCLMLAADKDDYREFYGLLEDKVVTKIFLPEIRGKRCMDAGFGWLFAVGQDGEASLVNPFTRDQIQLPHQNTIENYDLRQLEALEDFYQKAVLSSSPCQNPSDFVLMVSAIGAGGFLNFWKPGNKFWTSIATSKAYFDVVRYKGQFFSIDVRGRVWIADITKRESRMIGGVPSDFPFREMYYIVGSSEMLFIVARNGVQVRSKRERPNGYLVRFPGDATPNFTYATDQFRVLELDLISKKFKSIQDLGDRALFVGHSASVCIDQASKFSGIKSNHIYFTDGFPESYSGAENGGGRDMGIYNMADRSITSHYKGQSLSLIGPPIWVIPCSSCMSDYRP